MPRGIYNRNKSPKSAAKLVKSETKVSARNKAVCLIYRSAVKVWRSDSEHDAEYMGLNEFEQFRQRAARLQIPLTEEGE